jgi:hypothetical protein
LALVGVFFTCALNRRPLVGAAAAPERPSPWSEVSVQR